ncbi:hypothetical protein JCM1840_005290 [Sporobolomyces johnsonii]
MQFINADGLDYQLPVNAANDSIRNGNLLHVTIAALHQFPHFVPSNAFSPAVQLLYEQRRGSASALSPAEILDLSPERREHWRCVVIYWICATIVRNHPALQDVPTALRAELTAGLASLREGLPLQRDRGVWKSQRQVLPVLRHNLKEDDGVAGFLDEALPLISDTEKDKEKGAKLVTGDLATTKAIDRMKRYRLPARDPAAKLHHVHTLPQLFHVELNALYGLVDIYYSANSGSPASLHEHAVLISGRPLNPSCPNFRRAVDLFTIAYDARVLDCVRLAVDTSPSSSLDTLAQQTFSSFDDVLNLARTTASKFSFFSGSEQDRRRALEDEVGAFSLDFLASMTAFLELRHSIRVGNYGCIWAMIHWWMIFFKGSGSSNYADELLELHVKFHHELPPELQAAYEGAWLFNAEGKEGEFVGVDYVIEGDETFDRAAEVDDEFVHALATGASDSVSFPPVASGTPAYSRPYHVVPPHLDVLKTLGSIIPTRIHEPVPHRFLVP